MIQSAINQQAVMNQQEPEQEDQLIIQTFRFKFSPEFTEEMSNFAKIHQFDDRVTFKEAWKIWSEEETISSLINEEQKNLYLHGYDGNVLDKMFKSARYYYRKKKPEQENPSTIPRKEYIGASEQLIKSMDDYIQSKFQENTIKTKDNKTKTSVKPADAYIEFCKIYITQIEDEHILLKQDDTTPATTTTVESNKDSNTIKESNKEINAKIKKTFKNRYFLQSKKYKQ
jgi:hypothetical protein